MTSMIKILIFIIIILIIIFDYCCLVISKIIDKKIDKIHKNKFYKKDWYLFFFI